MSIQLSAKTLASQTSHPAWFPQETRDAKSLEGNPSADLRQWWENALDYYNAVVNGQESPPDPAAWQEFLHQLSWAQDQLSASQDGSEWNPSPTPPETAPLPEGAQAGSMGNLVYNQGDAHLEFNGETRPIDLWCNEIVLDVASNSAQVQIESTQDSRWDPPESVLKITVEDKATGQSSCYFVHNPQDLSSLKINTPGAKHVVDGSGKAQVGEYHEPGWSEPVTGASLVASDDLTLNTGPAPETPDNLLALWKEMGLDPENTQLLVPDSLLEEIKTKVKPPSQALLNALLKNDSVLHEAWSRAKDHWGDEHAISQVRNRLSELLGVLYGEGVNPLGDFPERVEADGWTHASCLFLDDFPYQLTKSFGLETLQEKKPDPTDAPEEKNEELEAMAQTLSDLQGVYLTPEEILAKAKQLGLDLLNPPSNPFDLKLVRFWAAIDDRFSAAVENYGASPKDGPEASVACQTLRDRIIEQLRILYPNSGVSVGDDGDDIHWFGHGYDILNQNNKSSVVPGDPDSWLNIFKMGKD